MAKIPHGRQTGCPQSTTLPAAHRGENRPGVIDCAAYAQGLRVATVEIADISEELKHEDRFCLGWAVRA